MSRSGTLQDALLAVDQFHRFSQVSKPTAVHGGANHVAQRSIEKLEKHKRRRKKVNSDDDDESGKHSKKTRRAERKKKDRRKHRKTKTRNSSRTVEGEIDEEGVRKLEKRKHRSRRLRSPQHDSSASEDEDSFSGSESSESDSSLRAEQVAADILEEFPGAGDDLQQLLQTVDGGRAVDISGLPSKCLVTLLQKLFQSLHLNKSHAGVYRLPSGAKPTLELLGPLLLSRQKAKAPTKSAQVQDQGPTLPQSPASERGIQSKVEEPHSSLPTTEPILNTQPKTRRVMGPAMPSAEMLEAAAKLTEAEEILRSAEAELENDPMVGPAPPAAVAEASSANDAERFEEVTRILAPDIGDAYETLGLRRNVTAGDLKKRYWKLSLLVHPDKCSHPQAHQAFMALNKAFKDLQDPLKRSEIDHKADEKEAREAYEEDLRTQRQAAQWRKLRGEEALPGDAQLLQGDVKDQARDEWMTVLPPERQTGGPPSQQNTFFSRSEKGGRGDTSAWTDTPLEKAQKAKMQYLEAYKQATLTGPSDVESSFEKEKAAKAAALMDQYNQRKRPLSLVEEHKQKSSKVTKKSKKEKSLPQQGKQQEWEGVHPWKPWDREKDLSAGRQSVKLTDAKIAGEGLSSRFGSNAVQRNFL